MVRFLTSRNNYYYENIVEEVKLIGEGEYNLNDLKEIRVTDSYLGLDQDVRQCQNEEPMKNCTTRHHLKSMLDKCGCLPFNIKHLNKVHLFVCKADLEILMLRVS